MWERETRTSVFLVASNNGTHDRAECVWRMSRLLFFASTIRTTIRKRQMATPVESPFVGVHRVQTNAL